MSAAAPPKLLRDTIADPAALTFPKGRWGIGVNGQTFQQEAVVSFGGYQYATWFGEGGRLCVGRRRTPDRDAAWEVIRFTDYQMADHFDVHNVAVIGICPRDGTIHLSFDHHCDPLNYRRSIPALATSPEKLPWRAESFGPITNALVEGSPLLKFTYPQFYTTPEGNLQLLYRLDSSGDGDWYIAEYSWQSARWTLLGMLFSRGGVHGKSRSRCAYPNPIRYDSQGRLHVTWCWRENLGLAGNHDLCYAYSDDRGRTWFGNTGKPVADLAAGRAISLDTSDIIFQAIPEHWGLMNVTTEFVDTRQRVHVVTWQTPNNAAGPDMDLNHWGYTHYWREPDGSWKHTLLPFNGRKPQVAVSRAGNAYQVFCKGPQLNYSNAIPKAN